jgi:ELWxxDGT repeat protein
VALEPGMAFFSAQTPEAGRELWITDGTESGTRLFADINPGSDSSDPSQMVARLMASAMDSVLFLMADDGVHGAEPWVINPALPEPTPNPTPNPDTWMVQ